MANYQQTIRGAYNAKAKSFSEQYQSVSTEAVLGGLTERLPTLRALDIGCGNGRDAKWLAEKGFIVDAADFSEGMLREAEATNAHTNVTYYHDSLPKLARIKDTKQKYDVITLSAVWMHLSPRDRAEAIGHILELANPNAVIFFSLRHGNSPADRPMFEVSADELKQMAAQHLVHYEYLAPIGDKLGRSDVWWDYVNLKVPADGQESLSILKQQVVGGAMSSTYKPVFLLALAEALKEQAQQTQWIDAGSLAVPMQAIETPWQRIHGHAAELGLQQLTHPNSHIHTPLQRPMRERLTRSGPLRFINDPASGKPVFEAIKIEDSPYLKMPKAMAEAIQAYHPLVCTGANAAIERFLQRRGNDTQHVERLMQRLPASECAAITN